MSFETRRLEPHGVGQFIDLIRVFEEVFEMRELVIPDENYLQQLLASEGFFVFVALQGDQVLGGLTAYLMHQYYSKAPLVYIYDLAVKTSHQRKGIGRMLIQATKEYAGKIGAEAVMVEADDGDEEAIRFYESTGGTKLKTFHFDYYLR